MQPPTTQLAQPKNLRVTGGHPWDMSVFDQLAERSYVRCPGFRTVDHGALEVHVRYHALPEYAMCVERSDYRTTPDQAALSDEIGMVFAPDRYPSIRALLADISACYPELSLSVPTYGDKWLIVSYGWKLDTVIAPSEQLLLPTQPEAARDSLWYDQRPHALLNAEIASHWAIRFQPVATFGILVDEPAIVTALELYPPLLTRLEQAGMLQPVSFEAIPAARYRSVQLYLYTTWHGSTIAPHRVYMQTAPLTADLRMVVRGLL